MKTIDLDRIYKDFYTIDEFGNVYNKKKGKRLKPYSDKDGYLKLCLVGESGKHNYFIHRLVALHYCEGRTETRKIVNHKDGNKTNNHYSNLEWVTNSENDRHAFELGLRKKNEENHSSIHSNDMVRTIAVY